MVAKLAGSSLFFSEVRQKRFLKTAYFRIILRVTTSLFTRSRTK